MKLLEFKYFQDFGKEYCFSILKGKNRSFLQFSFSWNDHTGWPFIQVSSGCGRLFSILFWAYRFGFDLDFLGYNWPSKYDN